MISKHPDIFELSISYTTRRPRQGEVHGREYYFVSVEEFKRVQTKRLRKSKRTPFWSTAKYMAIFTAHTRAR